MSPVHRKVFQQGRSTYDAALDRLRHVYSIADKVAVSFSGGKDSTAVLNMALLVAREQGRLPLDAVFMDEEAIHPETIEYVERVRNHPDIRLVWSCIPMKHRNACSRTSPWWYTWNPDDREKWCRPLPEWALHPDHGNVPEGIPNTNIPQQLPYIYGPEHGTVCTLVGLRTDESLNRYRAIAGKKGEYAFIAPSSAGAKHIIQASPIYDWSVTDVWTAPHKFGWDYNRAYETMSRMGMSLPAQRVRPPYGDEPLRGLWMYKQGWPELWAKMQSRVPGADCAGRYCKTELYGRGTSGNVQPQQGETWEEYVMRLIMKWPAKERKLPASRIANALRLFQLKYPQWKGPFPDKAEDGPPGNPIGWQELAVIVTRGDLKGRMLATKMTWLDDFRELSDAATTT